MKHAALTEVHWWNAYKMRDTIEEQMVFHRTDACLTPEFRRGVVT